MKVPPLKCLRMHETYLSESDNGRPYIILRRLGSQTGTFHPACFSAADRVAADCLPGRPPGRPLPASTRRRRALADGGVRAGRPCPPPPAVGCVRGPLP